jgi:ornithine decarboxylase
MEVIDLKTKIDPDLLETPVLVLDLQQIKKNYLSLKE